jgi:tRNA 5-methylaminomethyl-2-thiouridine biosynthesis bifunctional protein
MQNLNSNTANIEWRNGQPYAREFQDVYFSTDNGLLETDYVFIQGNNLKNRWAESNIKTFNIAETGFGTGLNFLSAANTWLLTAQKNAKLHFISVEKYPLSLQDMNTALSIWPQLYSLKVPFLKQYENLLDKSTSISLFDNRIQLSLLIGDATECFSKTNEKIDAWFLDGFAPSKNPEMWQTKLFIEMSRLSKPSTTFSTFTSAGDVRRGLINAGFQVTKRTGFGKKREMLIGHFLGNPNET